LVRYPRFAYRRFCLFLLNLFRLNL
jgi:hypothetical protein